MKAAYVLLFCVLSMATCRDVKEEKDAVVSIFYESGTRMSTFTFTIDAKKIAITKTGFDAYETELETPDETWNRFLGLISKIDLTALANLSPPSSLHASDRAAYGRLVIKTGSQTYTSPMFDDNNPPSDLKALVEEIYNTSENIGR